MGKEISDISDATHLLKMEGFSVTMDLKKTFDSLDEFFSHVCSRKRWFCRKLNDLVRNWNKKPRTRQNNSDFQTLKRCTSRGLYNCLFVSSLFRSFLSHKKMSSWRFPNLWSSLSILRLRWWNNVFLRSKESILELGKTIFITFWIQDKFYKKWSCPYRISERCQNGSPLTWNLLI